MLRLCRKTLHKIMAARIDLVLWKAIQNDRMWPGKACAPSAGRVKLTETDRSFRREKVYHHIFANSYPRVWNSLFIN